MKRNQAIIDEEMRAIARYGEIRQAMAREEERQDRNLRRRALRESFNSRFDSGDREPHNEGRESSFRGPPYLFEERGSRFGAGRYGLEGISEGEPRSGAAPFRSRVPENRTESEEFQHRGSNSRSRVPKNRTELGEL
ncbi:hypothetical protein BGAL_0073g00080 [Botrytis galanthina]|uniref:Uncharacterized protein n=1 Tax=Botrytis galanthina TaxID=278940 RepID=A0A4S8RGF4_9HELO|nr:hypothetical protein BGAL_0073g00080 [Botrytis galanthina]